LAVNNLNRARASQWGALFVWAWLLVAGPALGRDCPPARIDERAVVGQVVDGDTLRLTDGRSVRFIGINTPELGHDGRPDEPFAREARQALLGMLAPGDAVGLRLGQERHDRYHRLLAHVYTAQGVSVEARLLALGLAAQVVVPPNLSQVACYRAVEAEARTTNKGVWNGIYRPVPVAELARDDSGFHVITGRIEHIGESKRSLWFNFPRLPGEGRRQGVALRIDRKDLDYFGQWDPHQLQGRTVIVRGWTYSYKGQLVMRLRHPAALEIVP
jgi:micrococcal nuclease